MYEDFVGSVRTVGLLSCNWILGLISEEVFCRNGEGCCELQTGNDQLQSLELIYSSGRAKSEIPRGDKWMLGPLRNLRHVILSCYFLPCRARTWARLFCAAQQGATGRNRAQQGATAYKEQTHHTTSL